MHCDKISFTHTSSITFHWKIAICSYTKIKTEFLRLTEEKVGFDDVEKKEIIAGDKKALVPLAKWYDK